jgi:hypothetical protein
LIEAAAAIGRTSEERLSPAEMTISVPTFAGATEKLGKPVNCLTFKKLHLRH